MAKYLLLGFSAAKPGREADYNDWHANVHVTEVCGVPGVLSANRYEVSPVSPVDPGTPCLVVYEIEAEDPKTVLAEFGRRAVSEWTPMPESADQDRTRIMIFKQCD